MLLMCGIKNRGERRVDGVKNCYRREGVVTFAAVLFPRPFSRFSPKSHPNVAFPKCNKLNRYAPILQLFYPNLQKTSR